MTGMGLIPPARGDLQHRRAPTVGTAADDRDLTLAERLNVLERPPLDRRDQPLLCAAEELSRLPRTPPAPPIGRQALGDKLSTARTLPGTPTSTSRSGYAA